MSSNGSDMQIAQRFGRQVASRRVLYGWTQAELGNRIGRTQTAISYWESGKREPGLADLVRLAAVLGCFVDDLLERAPDYSDAA